MGGELKDKVARGVAWSMAEKIGSMLLTLGVRLIILRLLTPEILGFIAIPTALATIALVMVDSGFSQNLIRRKEPSEGDYKSVFIFNIAVSLLLYVVFVALSPSLAHYYEMPQIAEIAPVFFLLLPLGALSGVQNAIFTRQFRFELLSKVTFASSLVGGAAAIALAWSGFGIWSLVAERILQMGIKALLLWWLSDWRPRGKFSRQPLKEMAPFSFNLMATDLISNMYNKIPQLVLGRIYTADILGSFDQAIKLKDMPATSATQAVQGVTFPALAKIKEDAPKFAESYRQIIVVTAYIMFPIMLGFSAVANDMFAVLLGAKWMTTAPYFEIICLAGLFYPISMISYNVLKVKTEGAAILRLEIIKKAIMTLVFVITIPVSVRAVLWGLVFIAFCEMAINFWATTRFTTLSALRFIRTLLPSALTAAAMYIAVRLSACAIADLSMVRLLVQVAAGAICYIALSALFGLEGFREIKSIIRKQLKK